MDEARGDVAEQTYGLDLKNARSEVIERAQILKQTLSCAPTMAAVCGWFGISGQPALYACLSGFSVGGSVVGRHYRALILWRPYLDIK